MVFSNNREPEPEVMASAEEVAAYDRLSLKYLNVLHNGFIETVINCSPETGRFLEVGCGTGRISLGVAKRSRNIRITAVDSSRAMLAVARSIARSQDLTGRVAFRFMDARTLTWEDHCFDAVFCHNMLHHLEDPLPVLREMKRVVKPGGAFLVRDLVRRSRPLAWAHTWGFGLLYSRMMKAEYFASMRAAFTEDEFREIRNSLSLPGLRYTRQFITHHSLEKVSDHPRQNRVVIAAGFPAALLKPCYVSRPGTREGPKGRRG
jgi:ubiquinone/menaquinone biosynthesis C-methylase UbiE